MLLRGHQSGQPLSLQAQLDALVCSDICVPFAGPLSLNLPAGDIRPSVEAQTIARASALVPRMATGRDLHVESAWFDAPATSLAVRLDGLDLGIDDIFVEAVNGLSFARPEPVGDGIYQIGISGALDNLDLVGQTVRLTVRKGSQFSEQAIIISSASACL